MENENENKQNELMKVINFLKLLEIGDGLKFISFDVNDGLKFKNKNGEEVKVSEVKDINTPVLIKSALPIGATSSTTTVAEPKAEPEKKVDDLPTDTSSTLKPNEQHGAGFYSDTSSVMYSSRKSSKHLNSNIYSATSNNSIKKMDGGSFLSDTSSFNMSMNSLKSKNNNNRNFNTDMYSETSVNPIKNMKGGIYSETSSFHENNIVYSKTSSYNPNMSVNGGFKINNNSDMYSATSNLGLKGGFKLGQELSDAIDSTELKLSDSLDTNIFKKSSQKGGNVSSGNKLKNKMKEIGIKSTSTSSICE